MTVSLDFKQVTGLNVKMRKFSSIFRRTEAEAQEKAADLLLIAIKERTPVRTGAYRDSWYKARIVAGWQIATNSPYAARLEYGFVGTDSLGRNYAQAARPHVRPAMETIRPVFKKLYADAATKAWGQA